MVLSIVIERAFYHNTAGFWQDILLEEVRSTTYSRSRQRCDPLRVRERIELGARPGDEVG